MAETFATNGAPAEVAIIGMACLFPGARDLDTFWRNILSGVDAVTDPPPEAWPADLFYDPTARSNDRVYCKKGGFIGPLAEFNPLDYGVMPAGLAGGEPDQWLALKVAADALADAGYRERLQERAEERQRTAVILGKGTYLNRGNLNMVQHSLVVDEILQVLRALHPEYSAADLEALREELKRPLPSFDAETAPGLVPNIVAGRVANRLDLMGPTYTVDAACASSLIAVEIAMRELTTGACDLALAGGVQVTTPIPILTLFSQLGALSRSEQIRPFDAKADGTILGEGIGVLVLKRRADAERDGDRIYAVIKGVGVASDGRALGVLTPRVEGEVLALRRAYTMAGIAPESVGLIEAHGTGTAAGDQAEVEALHAVFGVRRGRAPHIALGSVKSMIGHAMPAAGVAGIIKAALALYHGVLPPTLHCQEPRAELQQPTTPFYINSTTRPWIHGAATPRRAGVNAFGFGGINAHVILEEAPSSRAASARAPGHQRQWDSELVALGATSRAQLGERARELEAYLASAPDADLLDVAYSVQAAWMEPGTDGALPPYRLAIVAESTADLRAKLVRAATLLDDPRRQQIRDVKGIYYSERPLYPEGKIAFLFPGEGSQYPNMLADLCLHFPEARACFDHMDRLFVDHPRGYRTSDFVFPIAGRSELEEALWQIDGAIEAVLAADMACFRLLTQLGIRPQALVGHSTGEYAALLAGGIIPLSEEEFVGRHVLQLNATYRDAVADGEVPRAAMLAVGAGVERVIPLLEQVGGAIYIGMDNCPNQTVVVGEAEAMERLKAALQQQALIHETLPFDRPYHTPLFGPYIRLFRKFFAQLPLAAPTIPTYSCVTAAPFGQDVDAIRTLAVEHWVSRVRFRETIAAMYADGVRIFVEVGARGNLTAFVADILRGQPHLAVPINIQQRSGIAQLNHLLAQLVVQGAPVNLAHLYERRSPRRLALDGSAAAPRQRPGAIKLATGWAAIELSEAAIARLRARNAAAAAADDRMGVGETPRAAASSASESAKGASPVATTPVAHATDRGKMITMSSASSGSPSASTTPSASAAADVPPIGADGRTQVMYGYLRLMEQFLQTQEAIMRQFLAGAAAQPATNHRPAQPVVASPAPVSQVVAPLPLIAPSAGAVASPAPSAPAAASPPAAAPSLAPPPAPPAAPPLSAPSRPQEIDVKAALLRLVSQKTGYPEEVLELTANLEADLGIDSIKRVEIVSAFGRETGLLDPQDMDKVSSLKTLGAMVDFFARTPVGDRPRDPGGLTELAAPSAEPSASQAARRLPFIRIVRACEPGQRLEALCTLDLNEDLFLRDHTLGRAISQDDAELWALPVVPLTVSMEILAEAAAYLAPGLVLTEMRDVRAYRWILVEDGAIDLLVTAQRTPAADATEFFVTLREADGPATQNGTPILEGTMIFAPAYAPAPLATPLTLREARPSRWQTTDIYERGMFHGPAFRAVSAVRTCSEEGAIAELVGLPVQGLLRSSPAPTFVAEPIILDAAGQVVGLWALEQLASEFVVFPYRLQALECYGPALRASERALCQVRSTLLDGGLITSTIEVVDQAGRVRLRLRGWEDKRFGLTHRFHDFILSSARAPLSEPWPLPPGHSEPPSVCRGINGLTTEFLTAHGGFWEKTLAHLILSRAERATWRSMASVGRRIEWLLGRLVAKEAVAQLVEREAGLALRLADIVIANDAHGKPVVEGRWLSRLGWPIALSITHTRDLAAAIACAGSRLVVGVGIDAEPVTRERASFVDAAFLPREQALLARLDKSGDDTWALRLWCAKEAAGKALGRGLGGRPHDLVVQEANPATGVVQIGLAGALADLFPAFSGKTVCAHTARAGEYTVASVWA